MAVEMGIASRNRMTPGCHGDPRQFLVGGLAILAMLALEDVPGGRPP
jgi:hypothetical protein